VGPRDHGTESHAVVPPLASSGTVGASGSDRPSRSPRARAPPTTDAG